MDNNFSELKKCTLCPRNCQADRFESHGYCGAPAEIMAARASLHMWEEPCISGEEGSGTVFFSGCPLRCVYCQNYHISDCSRGKVITADRLAEIFLELQEKKANNINLVTPTHYTPQIAEALRKAVSKGLTVPVVYNCSGYEKPETLEMMSGLVDIFLTDFKYMDPNTAKKYSNAPDYPEIAEKALECMMSLVGGIKFDKRGMMEKGIIVRHLILPGHTEESKEIIRYLYENYGDDICISIMNQYTPLENASKYPEIYRKVSREEYDDVIKYAESIGVENAFIQDDETALESFIPDFDDSGI